MLNDFSLLILKFQLKRTKCPFLQSKLNKIWNMIGKDIYKLKFKTCAIHKWAKVISKLKKFLHKYIIELCINNNPIPGGNEHFHLLLEEKYYHKTGQKDRKITWASSKMRVKRNAPQNHVAWEMPLELHQVLKGNYSQQLTGT